jgi:hypothetical protein
MSCPTYTTLATVGQSCVGATSGDSLSGGIGFWHEPDWILTGVGDSAFPVEYWLSHGHPNPFNPVSRFRFAVPKPSRVMIVLYDVSGRRVRILLDAEMEPGLHTIALDAGGLASGVYFCQMVSDSFIETRKIVLLK